MKDYDFVIIGGGASGVMAALSVNKHYPDANICLIEKENQLLSKVRASGNGRCNLSNKDIKAEHYFSIASSHSNKTKYLQTAFNQISFEETKKIFSKLGIYIRLDQAGRAYPYAEQAEVVVAALSRALIEKNIRIMLETEVVAMITSDQKLLLSLSSKSQLETSDLEKINQCSAEKIILACGSCAAEMLSGTKAGYQLLNDLGVGITELRPALLPIKIKLESKAKNLSGQRFKGKARLYKNGDFIFESQGEFLFRKDGLSGIAAMELARFIGSEKNSSYELKIDFVPELDEEEIREFLNHKSASSEEDLINFAMAFLRKKIAIYLAKKANNLKELIKLLKSSSFQVIGSLTNKEAQVMAGGLALEQLFLPSFALKKDPRIYVCGELLDIDGRTGGYNLQWAWTSGYLAGKLLDPY